MDWLVACGIGAAGGASMEAIDVIKAIRWHKKMPWDVQPDSVDPPRYRPDLRPGEECLPAPGAAAYTVAAILRLLVSGTLTGVIGSAYPSRMNTLVAYLVGLGALSIIQQAVALVPLAVKSAGRAALGGMSDRPQHHQPFPQQTVAVEANEVPAAASASGPAEPGWPPDARVSGQEGQATSGGAG